MELGKENAPSILLQDFNYLLNKAISQYINKQYNIYDLNQQTTDNLRVLTSTAILTPKSSTKYGKILKNIYEVIFPRDYVHLLNCICVYKLKKNHKCKKEGDYVQFAAKRLTADAWSVVMDDYYNRPLPERPYYYVHNVNKQVELPTNEYVESDSGSTDTGSVGINEKSFKNRSEFPKTIQLNFSGTGDNTTTLIHNVPGLRNANASDVRCEIRCGDDNTIYELDKVLIDYIKAPQTVYLTQEQIDLIEDTSQIMEFPDYVCREIISELVTLVMSVISDPRISTHIPVSQTIASPIPQQSVSKK